MIRFRGQAGGLALCAALLAGCAPTPTPDASSDEPPISSPEPVPTVVVFSGTAGFRHDSIESGLAVVAGIGEDTSAFTIVATEDPGVLRAELPAARALVLLNTTGDVFDSETEAVVEEFVEGGGGLVGIHAATDTEHDWSWFRAAIGAQFQSHPAVQDAVVAVVAAHPSTLGLPSSRTFRDEWYNFTEPLPNDFTVLATVDEATYDPGVGAMGPGHPIVWCRSGPGEGEVWYTALGHETTAYADAGFQSMLAGGILSVLGEGCVTTTDGS